MVTDFYETRENQTSSQVHSRQSKNQILTDIPDRCKRANQKQAKEDKEHIMVRYKNKAMKQKQTG